jgi:hypothetical protein
MLIVGSSRAAALGPRTAEVDLLRDFDGVIDLDAEMLSMFVCPRHRSQTGSFDPELPSPIRSSLAFEPTLKPCNPLIRLIYLAF